MNDTANIGHLPHFYNVFLYRSMENTVKLSVFK